MAANSSTIFLPEAPADTLAWLFPGQGAQAVGMGADLWRQSPAARQVYDIADDVLGYELSRLCFEGPEERLRQTAFTQPAILATSLACLAAAVEAGRVRSRPAFVAGHSLGEYTALIVAGALSLEDGLRLIQERAHLMDAASQISPGAMAAILGLDEEQVIAICAETDVDVCNLNLPSQTVIGGWPDGVARAVALAKQWGATRVLELNVSGAFHSRLMQPVIGGLAVAVSQTDIAAPLLAVVANASAMPLSSANAVRDELVSQIASPVRWHESITLMAQSGVSSFVEFGPGKVLTGLAKRLVPGATLENVSGLADLSSTQPAMSGQT